VAKKSSAVQYGARLSWTRARRLAELCELEEVGEVRGFLSELKKAGRSDDIELLDDEGNDKRNPTIKTMAEECKKHLAKPKKTPTSRKPRAARAASAAVVSVAQQEATDTFALLKEIRSLQNKYGSKEVKEATAFVADLRGD